MSSKSFRAAAALPPKDRKGTSSGSGTGVPDGGTTGQVLAKQSADDGDAIWVDAASGVPDGGTTGQVLAKGSAVDGDVEWVDAGGGPSAYGRTTTAYSTGSLADLAENTGYTTLAKAYRLLKIEVSHPCRVRLYDTVAHRTADASRAIGTDPTGDHGLMFEFVAVTGLLSATLSPTVDGFSGASSSSIPIAVQNRNGSTVTVTVTFTWIQTED